MARLKVDLISPTAEIWRAIREGRARGPRVFRFSMLPTLSVAACMPADVDVRIVDENVEPVDLDTDADLVGISFMTFNAPRAYELADRLRDRGKTVIFGGFHPTFLPDEAIGHCDAVCIGEAEYSVPRMIEDFRAGRLQPFYESGPVDLSDLPLPRRDLLQKRLYATPNVLIATRGCPYRCTYCSIAAFNDYRIRTRPVEAVIDELERLGKYVIFMDDNIIGDREYARRLFEAMIPLRKRWHSQCGIHITEDRDLLRLAVASGCNGIFTGLETLSQVSLADWEKRPNRARDYVRQIAMLHDRGIGVLAGFVFGGDDDHPDVFPRTVEFLDEAGIDALQATRLTPFPGTPLFERMDEEDRIFDKNWAHYDFGHVVYEPRHLTREQLHLGVWWVSRQFYSRRRVARRFYRELRSLGLGTLLHVTGPVNLAYRVRFSRNGTFAGGSRFAPDVSPRAAPRTTMRGLSRAG